MENIKNSVNNNQISNININSSEQEKIYVIEDEFDDDNCELRPEYIEKIKHLEDGKSTRVGNLKDFFNEL